MKSESKDGGRATGSKQAARKEEAKTKKLLAAKAKNKAVGLKVLTKVKTPMQNLQKALLSPMITSVPEFVLENARKAKEELEFYKGMADEMIKEPPEDCPDFTWEQVNKWSKTASAAAASVQIIIKAAQTMTGQNKR